MTETAPAPTSGILADSVHSLPARVYWEDTDAGGIVYHASYIRWMERGRTEFLRVIGLHQTDLRARHNLLFVVRSMNIKFLKPGHFDDSLIICTQCTSIAGASLHLHQDVRRDSEVLASAEVVCVSINEQGRAFRMPQDVRETLAPTLQNNNS